MINNCKSIQEIIDKVMAEVSAEFNAKKAEKPEKTIEEMEREFNEMEVKDANNQIN
jgi:hypothetical protein